jgi:hypothetical protein
MQGLGKKLIKLRNLKSIKLKKSIKEPKKKIKAQFHFKTFKSN